MQISLKKKASKLYVYSRFNKQHITNKELKMNNRELTYKGKSVYIGIDVH